MWKFAREAGLAIVTKDRDFLLQCAAFGHPPRVILLRIGNCSVDVSEKVIRSNRTRLLNFDGDETTSYVVLSR